MLFQYERAPCLTGQENVCELDGERESVAPGKGSSEELGSSVDS